MCPIAFLSRWQAWDMFSPSLGIMCLFKWYPTKSNCFGRNSETLTTARSTPQSHSNPPPPTFNLFFEATFFHWWGSPRNQPSLRTFGGTNPDFVAFLEPNVKIPRPFPMSLRYTPLGLIFHLIEMSSRFFFDACVSVCFAKSDGWILTDQANCPIANVFSPV